MIEIFVALLAFLGAIVGTTLAGTWRRSEHQAETLRTSFIDSVDAAGEFTMAVSSVINYLGVEELQGQLHEFQREEFRDAMRLVDVNLMSAGAKFAVLRVVTPQPEARYQQLSESMTTCAGRCSNVAGWRPHPDRPPEGNPRQTIIRNAATPGELAAQIGADLRVFGHQLDGLSNDVGTIYHRSFLVTQWINRGLGVLVAVAVAAIVVVAPRLAWKSNVQDDRVVWINALTHEVLTKPLPHIEETDIADPEPSPLDGPGAAFPGRPVDSGESRDDEPHDDSESHPIDSHASEGQDQEERIAEEIE